jgi:hypothetical protein
LQPSWPITKLIQRRRTDHNYEIYEDDDADEDYLGR